MRVAKSAPQTRQSVEEARWIPVSEKLPPQGQPVFTLEEDGHMDVAMFGLGAEDLKDWGVTHWCLPPAYPGSPAPATKEEK
jgi:hypothetical protein